MAKNKGKKTQAPPPRWAQHMHLIEITRHLAGPPRRAPGQRMWMTDGQIEDQGLVRDRDFKEITTNAHAR